MKCLLVIPKQQLFTECIIMTVYTLLIRNTFQFSFSLCLFVQNQNHNTLLHIDYI